MLRKSHVLFFICVLGFAFCLTNGFADKVDGVADEVGRFADDNFRFPVEDFAFPTADGAAYIQGKGEIQRGPDRIIGSRDFEKMRDLPRDSQDYQLGTKVGWFVVPSRDNPNRIWICTGFLVGPDLFMTNHHCIHDNFGLLPLGNAEIYMDYYEEPSVDPTRGGATAGVSEILRMDASKDYALLKLDSPIGNTYGWLELDSETVPNTSQSVKLISHPEGRSKEIVRRNSQIVDPSFETPFLFAYLADTQGGSSGSPVFLREGTGVIGIHHSAYFNRVTNEPLFNAGSLMSYIVPEIQQWLPGGSPPTPPPTPTGDMMYWADWGTNKIQQATLNGTNVTDLIVGLPAPHGITVDVAGGYIYWTDHTGSIQRANLNGANRQTLVTGLEAPLGLALDVVGNHIYWTDRDTRRIQRANLNGANVQTLVTGLTGPSSIALDIAGGKMYWTDWDATTDRIQRANLNGSNVETLIPTGSGLIVPQGIALDIAGGKMYWTDYPADRIQRANLNGSFIETLSHVESPTVLALDLDAEKVYWAAQAPGRIQRANLNGSFVETLVTGLEYPYGFALGIPLSGGPSPPSPPSSTISFNPPTIDDQTYPVNTPITGLLLPLATGGTQPYTYTLAPVPPGLHFDRFIQYLTGTPTTPGRTSVTYTATDAIGASGTLNFTITVTDPGDPTPPDPGPIPGALDVNGDGQVNVIDLAIVALFYGTQVPIGISLPADVNADGVVDLSDLTAVAQGIDAAGGNLGQLTLQAVEAALVAAAEQVEDIEDVAAAPNALSGANRVHRNVAAALADAKLEKGIPHTVLSELLHLLTEMRAIPETTALLPNYPNPFNPETWIPYHLAQDAEVTLTIYDVRGIAVRTLKIGQQPAGVYQSKHRAAYWDGKNQSGEKVASGLYFYTLTAGEFTATRKLLIAK